MKGYVHLSSLEVLVSEIHIVFLFGHLIALAELVHVQLADEGGEVAMAEEVGENLLLHLLPALYQDFIVAMPAEEVIVLLLLNRGRHTSRM
jgi:hypothetical protein